MDMNHAKYPNAIEYTVSYQIIRFPKRLKDKKMKRTLQETLFFTTFVSHFKLEYHEIQ